MTVLLCFLPLHLFLFFEGVPFLEILSVSLSGFYFSTVTIIFVYKKAGCSSNFFFSLTCTFIALKNNVINSYYTWFFFFQSNDGAYRFIIDSDRSAPACLGA
jgi:hypothetical protein